MSLRPVANPPNPFATEARQWLGPPPAVGVEVYEERAKSILSENDSPDIPFRWSINPYRGCQHACAYCYARPTHEYLGFGAGTDFDTRLIAKVNAAELLRAKLMKKSWRRESINFSGVTDCYQPIEATYQLTRQCLEACYDFRNPVAIVTKGRLILRDLDLLKRLHKVAAARIYLSIPFASDEMSRAIEPYAPPTSVRFETMRQLVDAGLPVGLMLAPVIPALNDRDIPELLRRAAEAGARTAGYTALRLAGSVAPVFLKRVQDALPLKAQRVHSLIRQMRAGRLNDPRFGNRMSGDGEIWDSTRKLFDVSLRRFGLTSLGDERDARRAEVLQRDRFEGAQVDVGSNAPVQPPSLFTKSDHPQQRFLNFG